MLPLLLLASSCTNNDDSCTPAPIPCNGTEPTHALLNLHVSSSLAWVSIYSGSEVETGTLLSSGLPPLGATDWSVSLPLGYYSAKARYIVGKDTFFTVDGSTLSSSSVETCSGTCYSAANGEVDLKLDTTLVHH